MTPDEAYERLCVHFLYSPSDHLDPIIVNGLRNAFQALDKALKSDGELPRPWQRLTASTAAARAGKPSPAALHALVAKGYAPPPDGHDDTGRAWWHPATIDAYVRGDWKARPARDPNVPPPVTGPAATREAWAAFAARHGVEVGPRTRRDVIMRDLRARGVIE